METGCIIYHPQLKLDHLSPKALFTTMLPTPLPTLLPRFQVSAKMVNTGKDVIEESGHSSDEALAAIAANQSSQPTR
ncbi:hypothetical protein V6N13_130555 [Hibiscus sabdariffa]